MTDPTRIQPDLADSDATLVQPEGVNAGSAQSLEHDAEGSRPHGDALIGSTGGGGKTSQGTTADAEFAGAPDTAPVAPGQYAADAGQDSGSMS